MSHLYKHTTMIALPYVILLLSYILMSIIWQGTYINNKRKQLIRFTCCTIFILFFGFRGYIGWDVNNYYPMFLDCQKITNIFQSNKIDIIKEPGFYIYMSILKSIWNNYHFFIFCSTLIDIIILNAFLKRYCINYPLAIVIYLAMMMAFEIDLQRNVKSMLLFLLSIKYIEQRKFLPFVCLNLLGITFHITSIIYLSCYFFINKRATKRFLITTFIILQLIYLFQIPIVTSTIITISNKVGGIFGNLLIAYTQNTHLAISKGISIGHIERTLTYIAIIINYKAIVNANKTNIIFVNAFIIYFACQTMLFELSVLANRLSMLFVFSYLVIWPSIIYRYKLKTNQMCLMIVLFTYSILKVSDYNSGIFYKYDNVLTGITSFQERNATFDAYAESILIDNAQ